MKNIWMLKRTVSDIKSIAEHCGISETLALILANRGLKDENEIKKFLKCSLDDLYNPFLMKDMDKGVEIMIKAIKEQKNILVYGDYDADGVTSTVILYKAIKECGGNVEYYIPDRENEGYGMSSNRINILKQEGKEVLISCDNGISAMEQVELAKALGMTVIITDHHELPFVIDENGNRTYRIPGADAVINPKQEDCRYPFKSLCGAGIAFKFTQGLFERLGKDKNEAYKYIEYAGIGTICDIVDLLDENRIIAKNALEMISSSKNPGLIALKNVLGLQDKRITAYNIGFQIGPCINATGRLETAALSVELLISNDNHKVTELASRLFLLNKERQDITNKNVEEIIEWIQESDYKKQKVLVIYKEDVHESIAGIVAGKIKERFYLPTIVITKGKEMPKGSGRSIEDYNMFEELLECSDLIDKFGGHPMAAGLSLKKENIDLLRQRLNHNCKLTEEEFTPKLRIDKRLKLSEVSVDLINELEKLQPFGKSNTAPLFAEKDIFVRGISYLGKDNSTLKLYVDIGDGKNKMEAICFGRSDEFKTMLEEKYGFIPRNIKMDLVFSPTINEYMGNKRLQLKINDFRFSS